MKPLNWLSVSLITLMIGCSQSKTPQKDSTARTPAVDVFLSSPAQIVKNQINSEFERAFTQMGMPFHIKIFDVTDHQKSERAVREAIEGISQIENLMSEWMASSEISALNRAAGRKPVMVSEQTYEVLKTAQALALQSAGAFDPTWAAFRGVWQFKSPAPTLPKAEEIKHARSLVDHSALVLDDSASTAYLKHSDMQVGLGSIAKGYAIDLAVKTLRKYGFTRFMVDGGGDVFVEGTRATRRPWRIAIKHPRKDGTIFGFVDAQSQSVVTSGDYEHFFELNEKRYHHIIDVRTGYPADQCVSVTVVSASATIADALATAIFVLGPSKGVELLAHYPNTKAVILASDGFVYGRPATFLGSFPKRWQSIAMDDKAY
jgi:thiamine biosynthesis lipoprotein